MSEIRIGKIIKVADTTIIPVERTTISSEIHPSTLWWYGSKELYAVVICTSQVKKAFDKESQEISISELVGKLPQLEILMTQYDNDLGAPG